MSSAENTSSSENTGYHVKECIQLTNDHVSPVIVNVVWENIGSKTVRVTHKTCQQCGNNWKE